MLKKGVALSVGLAAMARKRAEKELRKRGISRNKVKCTVKRIGGVALKEGRRVEKILRREIAKEMKKAKPSLKRAVKKRVKKVKGKAKKVLRKARRKCRR